MPYPWKHNRRFNAYVEYLRQKFGERVQKLSIDAGFTCPNRDGSIGKGGCTFCHNNAFNPSYCQPEKSITQQITEGIEFHKNRYRKATKYLVYFQAYSNTYADNSILEKRYREALKFKDVVGLVIGTRPDCLSSETLDLLKELNNTRYIKLEVGIESCYNKTLERINRQHSFEDTTRALNRCRTYQLDTGGHMIFGLPGESQEEMMDEASILSTLPLNTIKFHQLQILKNTAMAKEYHEKPQDFIRFSLNDYIDFIVKFTEQLNPAFAIERFAGEVPPRFIVGSNWESIRYDQVLNLIEKKLEKENTYQGKLFHQYL